MRDPKKIALDIATERLRFWQGVTKELGMKKSRIVEDWRSAWRWFSMQLHVVGTLIAGVLLMVPSMPQEVQDLIPVEWRAVAIAVWFCLGIVARVVKQKEA